jgi:O-antigen/teichoic acid export membrane protein
MSAPSATSEGPPARGGGRLESIRASIWTLGGYGGAQLLRFGGNLILTRLLFPEVFGLAALVSIFIQGLFMFSDTGTGAAIIQSPHGDDPGFLNTCWTIQVVRGGVIWIVSWAIAGPVAAFYGQPLLAQLIPVAGLNAVMNGFEATSIHSSVRHLKMRRVVTVDLVTQAVNIATIIGLALVYRSSHPPNDPRVVWAVVGGNLAGNLVKLVLTHTFLDHIRHRLVFDRHWLRVQYRFGRWITFSTILTFLSDQSDRLLFGKLIPIQTLGVYNIGATLGAMPTQALEAIGSRVLFPTYSRIVGRDDFSATFAKVRLPLLIGGGTVVSGMIACGPSMVRILYDSRYWEAGWIVQFLSVAAWFQVLESSNSAALLAMGHTHWKAAIGAIKVVTLLAFVTLGFHLDGFRGALIGLVLSDLAKYAISMVGVAGHGLRTSGVDFLLTAFVAAVSFGGYVAGNALATTPSRSIVPFAVSAAVVLVAWGLVALWYLQSTRGNASGQAVPPG